MPAPHAAAATPLLRPPRAACAAPSSYALLATAALSSMMVALSPASHTGPLAASNIRSNIVPREDISHQPFQLPARIFNKVARLRGGDLEAEKNKGNALFQQGKYEQARDLYTRALNSASDKTSEVALAILRNRAAAHMRLGDYQKAVDDSTEVLKHVPDCNKALLRRAMAIEKLGDVKLFVTGYRDARKLIMDGEGATGTETLKEIMRIEEKMRAAFRKTLKTTEEICKNCYEDAAMRILHNNMNLIDRAEEDLNVACDEVCENNNANFSGEYAFKCIDLRMNIYKQKSNFECLHEDLTYMIESQPRNVSLRLLDCVALEASEQWKKLLKQARYLVYKYDNISLTYEQERQATGHLARATEFVKRIMAVNSSKDYYH